MTPETWVTPINGPSFVRALPIRWPPGTPKQPDSEKRLQGFRWWG